MSQQKKPLDPFLVTLLATCFVVGLLGVYFGGQMYQKNEQTPTSFSDNQKAVQDGVSDADIADQLADNLFDEHSEAQTLNTLSDNEGDHKTQEEIAQLEPFSTDSLGADPLTVEDMEEMDAVLEFANPDDIEVPLIDLLQPKGSVDKQVVTEAQEPEEDVIASLSDDIRAELDKPKKPLPMQGVILPEFQDERPRVVIIIDDLGLDSRRSKKIVNLEGPLTLAFLPYAKNLDEKTKMALENGHELLIHVPMEPMNPDLDPGPMALLTEMNGPDFEAMFEKILKSFDGYVGINNHMGSKLTQDQKAMDYIMDRLRQDNLIFVDSVTINTSVAAQTARDHHISYAERDVFLDHVPEKEFVVKALTKLEKRAQANGYAIAIGHPKDVTIDALAEWLPTLEDKGLKLVPVSKVLKKPMVGEISQQGQAEGTL